MTATEHETRPQQDGQPQHGGQPQQDGRAKHDLDAQEAAWQEWVESTSALLAIDPDLVDIRAIHHLTKIVAHRIDRPLAPVASFMLGLAIGSRGADADPEALRRTIEATAEGRAES